MARSTILSLATIISLLLPLLLLSLNPRVSFAQDMEYDDEDQDEEYVLDTPTMSMLRPRSRFLQTVLKKGAKCTTKDQGKRNICNGVGSKKGTGLLYCCKKHCRNVLGDRNNCGACGRKCKYSQRCCGGKCRNVLKSESNCGKCNKKCGHGVKCEMGICGYN